MNPYLAPVILEWRPLVSTYAIHQTDPHHFVCLKCQLDLLFTKLFALVEQFLNVIELFLALFTSHASHLGQVIISHLINLLQ